MESLAQLLLKIHKEEHPNCTYGDKPHFVPPSFGQVGFYLCDPPKDLTNYSRDSVCPRCGCFLNDTDETQERYYCRCERSGQK